MKQRPSGNRGGRTMVATVESLLTASPQSLTQLGARTGYEWNQIAYALKRLRAEGRAHWSIEGWTRGETQ